MDEQVRDSTGAAIHIRAYRDADWPAICVVQLSVFFTPPGEKRPTTKVKLKGI